MKKWAKFVNGNLEVFSKRYIHDEINKVYYSNPTEEQMRICEYKEYIETECTLEAKEGYDIVPTYNEDENTITKVWEYVEINYDEYYEEIPTENVSEETESETTTEESVIEE